VNVEKPQSLPSLQSSSVFSGYIQGLQSGVWNLGFGLGSGFT